MNGIHPHHKHAAEFICWLALVAIIFAAIYGINWFCVWLGIVI